jgi:hypothetical protein
MSPPPISGEEFLQDLARMMEETERNRLQRERERRQRDVDWARRFGWPIPQTLDGPDGPVLIPPRATTVDRVGPGRHFVALWEWLDGRNAEMLRESEETRQWLRRDADEWNAILRRHEEEMIRERDATDNLLLRRNIELNFDIERALIRLLLLVVNIGGGIYRYVLGLIPGVTSLLELLHHWIQREILVYRENMAAENDAFVPLTDAERELLDRREAYLNELRRGIRTALEEWADEFEHTNPEHRISMLGDLIGQILPELVTLSRTPPDVPPSSSVPSSAPVIAADRGVTAMAVPQAIPLVDALTIPALPRPSLATGPVFMTPMISGDPPTIGDVERGLEEPPQSSQEREAARRARWDAEDHDYAERRSGGDFGEYTRQVIRSQRMRARARARQWRSAHRRFRLSDDPATLDALADLFWREREASNLNVRVGATAEIIALEQLLQRPNVIEVRSLPVGMNSAPDYVVTYAGRRAGSSRRYAHVRTARVEVRSIRTAVTTDSIRSAIRTKIRRGQLGVPAGPGVAPEGTIMIMVPSDSPQMAQMVRDAIDSLDPPTPWRSDEIRRAQSVPVRRIEVVAGGRVYAYNRVGHLRYVPAR